MSQFEWTTEDDDQWEDDPQPSGPQRRWLRWLVPLVLFVAVAALVATVVTQLRDTVDTATSETEADLRATLDVLFTAAEQQDIELFQTLLSGRDMAWSSAYQDQVGRQTLLERRWFGLTLQHTTVLSDNILIDPSFNSAQITATVDYSLAIGNGLTTTVQLERPFIMRQGESNWLLAPPEPEYWGSQRVFQNDLLVFSAYERDLELARRIMLDIELAWSSLCNSEPTILRCRTGMATIDFSNHPIALSTIVVPPLEIDGDTIVVPTPTLFGRPTDAASYDALVGAYGNLLLSTLLANELDYVCCEQFTQFRATTDQLLAQVGFAPTPTIDYAQVFAELDQTDWPAGWHGIRGRSAEPGDIMANHALLTWLNTIDAEIGPLDVLANTSAVPDKLWFELFGNADLEAELFSSFRQFLIRNISQPTLQQQVPRIDATYACGDTLYRGDYTLPLAIDTLVGTLQTLPDDSGYVLSAVNNPGTNFEPAWLVRDEQLVQLSDTRLIPYSRTQDPAGNVVYLIAPERTGLGGAESQSGAYALDYRACSADECALQFLPGLPTWSPDGEHVMYLSGENWLRIASAEGEIKHNIQTFAGFWLDAERFAYQTSAQSYESQAVGTFESVKLFDLAWLQHVLPNTAGTNIPFAFAYGNPRDAHIIYLYAIGIQGDTNGEWFVINLLEGSAIALEGFANSSLSGVSADGDWLLLTDAGDSLSLTASSGLYIHNWRTDTTRRVPWNRDSTYHWLPNQPDWLVVWHADTLTNSGIAQLVQLSTGKSRFLDLPADQCQAFAIHP